MTRSPASPSDDPVSLLVAALVDAGAVVSDLGGFDPIPLGGRGVSLCVSGQQVNVYVFGTPEQRAAAASTIDPNDPSHVGTSIVEWSGTPQFWGTDRIIVLYLGNDPAVTAGLTSILGQPFASGQGRNPGLIPLTC